MDFATVSSSPVNAASIILDSFSTLSLYAAFVYFCSSVLIIFFGSFNTLNEFYDTLKSSKKSK